MSEGRADIMPRRLQEFPIARMDVLDAELDEHGYGSIRFSTMVPAWEFSGFYYVEGYRLGLGLVLGLLQSVLCRGQPNPNSSPKLHLGCKAYTRPTQSSRPEAPGPPQAPRRARWPPFVALQGWTTRLFPQPWAAQHSHNSNACSNVHGRKAVELGPVDFGSALEEAIEEYEADQAGTPQGTPRGSVTAVVAR